MGTTSLLDLDELLLQVIGDWLSHPVTTALTTSTSVVSTHLTKYRSDADYYNGRWCYFEDYNNEGDHYISDDDGTNTLTSYDTFVVESPSTNKATFRLSRFPWATRIRCIARAIQHIYPHLYRSVDNRDLITGNILPPFNWSTTALLDVYAEPSGTLLKTTDGDYFRKGSSSARVTASGANDVISIDSTDYPRLLDLMNTTIDFKCWAHPVDADDDAFLTIQYTESDGTSVTVNSTTECDTGQFTLLKIEDQAIPDDIVQIQFRLRTLTTLQNVYFDQPRVTGRDVTEYLLPSDFQDGRRPRVQIQTSGYADDICDDLLPIHWEEIHDYEVFNDGTYWYLRLPTGIPSERQIRLQANLPLEEVDDDAETISLIGERLQLIVQYAAHLLYEEAGQPVASEDIGRYEDGTDKFLRNYYRLLQTLGMPAPHINMNLPSI